MQISPIQQNNTSFKAYFKQDSAGVFMDLYKKTKNMKRLEKAMVGFKERCPNHELEITGKDVVEKLRHYEFGKFYKTNVRYYQVRNNQNDVAIWVGTPQFDEDLSQLVENLTELSDDTAKLFWEDKNEQIARLEALTSEKKFKIPQDVPTQNYDDLPLKEKIKSFFDFWFMHW